MMKPLIYSVAGAACVWFAGCQKTTTTGPAPAAPATPGTNVRTDAREVKKLTLMAAKDHSVERGESDDVLVTINRDNFDDAVQINLNGLPAGVELVQKNAVIPADDSSLTLTLRTAPDAPLGEHLVTLVAEAPGIEKNTQTFKLKIEEAD